MNPRLSEFQSNGFIRLEQAVNSQIVDQLIEAVEHARRNSGSSARAAGVRNLLSKSEVVRKLAKSDTLTRIAENHLGKRAKPVKAILFDKTPNSNWYVTWHQDVTIAVKERIDVEGFGPWSIKDDTPHVQPPAAILEQMLSIRLHLDDCDETNGAIKFIPGSHRVGIMDSSRLAEWRDNHDAIICPANHGDIILMRPLILHSSTQSTNPNHRRVLHIEYTSADLPAGLEWAEAP